MKKKDFLILWVLAIGLWLLIMPLRGYHFLWAITAHSIAFAILTWWALKKYEPKAGFWPTLIPMLAPWLFELGMRCFIENSLFSLPITVMPIWAVVTVSLFYRYRKVWLLVVFPVYAIEKDNPILTSCNIMAYPRLLILDKDRTVIFNGSLESAKRKLKDL